MTPGEGNADGRFHYNRFVASLTRDSISGYDSEGYTTNDSIRVNRLIAQQRNGAFILIEHHFSFFPIHTTISRHNLWLSLPSSKLSTISCISPPPLTFPYVVVIMML
jgi:hypothetical protein